MKNKKLSPTVYKVIAVVFIVYGALVSLSSVLAILSGGVAGYANMLAAQSGVEVGTYPYMYSFLGSVLFILLALGYFVSAYGLLKFKKWTFYTFYFLSFVAVLEVLMGMYWGMTNTLIQLVWAAIYGAFGYYLSKNKEFKN